MLPSMTIGIAVRIHTGIDPLWNMETVEASRDRFVSFCRACCRLSVRICAGGRVATHFACRRLTTNFVQNTIVIVHNSKNARTMTKPNKNEMVLSSSDAADAVA